MDNSILRYFGGTVYKALAAYDDSRGNLCEIRLRAGKAVGITTEKGYYFLNANGLALAMKSPSPQQMLTVTADDIRRTFEALCRFSVHSCQGQISRGFITVAGGHRAGICGTAVYSSDGRVENLKYISGINLRIAREIKGAADRLSDCVKRPTGVLICGEPCSGKTTVLRDLCRQAGDRFPVSLIDERGEIAAACGGVPNNDVGANTDVLSGFTKGDGIITAVRSMSPRLIVCDEIGSEEDIRALRLAALSGVKAAAAVHCGLPDELMRRENLRRLIAEGVFEYIVFVHQREIVKIYSGRELIEVCGKEQRNG